MKKKRTVLWISLVVVALIVVAGAIWGKNYYQDRYVGSDYYAMVPMDFDTTPQTMYDRDGNPTDTGKIYILTAYDDQGNSKEVEFPVYGDDPSTYPQPGSYLWVSASKQLVVNWKVITVADVPATALAKINAQ